MCRGLRSSERFGFFTSCIRTPEDHIARLALVRATPRRRCSRSLARARAQFLPLTPPPHAPSTLLSAVVSSHGHPLSPSAAAGLKAEPYLCFTRIGADVSASRCLGPGCRGLLIGFFFSHAARTCTVIPAYAPRRRGSPSLTAKCSTATEPAPPRIRRQGSSFTA